VIALDGRVTFGHFTAELALTVEPGEVIGVVGENGSGKSTLLRVLAGLTPLDEGRLTLDGVVADDPADDTFVDPDERPTGVVMQDPTLFPHLDLLDNVAFGPRRAGRPKAEARAVAQAWLDKLGVGAHARSRPRAVSGGQAQRAAIARTLAREPAVVLLDEPFAALDQDGRTLVRRLLRTEIRRDDRAVVLVSHDPVDALALTDRLVVLEDGRVTQTGSPAEITRRPRSAFVARLVGLNLLEGRADGTSVTLPNGGGELVTATSATGEVLVTIPPHAIALYRSRPDGSPRNTWSIPVEDLEAVGDRVRVALGGPIPLVAEVTPAAVADLALQPGDQVWATVKATEVDVYPA
jgi:molybdate transport system ATP-binding protein